jgi:hypothetical protein
MPTVKNILFTLFAACIMLVSANTYASIFVTGATSSIEIKKVTEKYSLKNLNALSHKTASFASLKSSLEYKGFASNNTISNVNTAAYLKYNKGNVSYVIPYHYKVILPKFKTPSAQ